MNSPAGPVSLFALIALGIGVLWSVRLAYRRRRTASDDVVRLVLTITGWLLVLVGILGTAAQAAAPLVIVVLVVAAMAVARYRTLESRAHVACLSAAAIKGIPLETAARAISAESVDDLGLRSARLAVALEAGKPLSLALEEARIPLPIDTELAVRLGIETGDLSTAIVEISKPDDDTSQLVRSVFEKYFYLALIAMVLMGITTFMMIKVVPVMKQLFVEFDTQTPEITTVALAISDLVVRFNYFLWPPLALGFVVLCIGTLYYMGWLPRDLPFVNWITRRFDCALVMRALAVSVRQHRPISQMVFLLAAQYPKWSIRAQLLAAGNAISEGHHWCSALHTFGLLRDSDVAVLSAAERNGNLRWALQEMADQNLRTLAYRMQLWLNVAFPTILVFFGGVVALYVVGLFAPLANMIEQLAPVEQFIP